MCGTWSSPTGTKFRLVDEYVGRLQDRITEKSMRGEFPLAQLLLLILVTGYNAPASPAG